MKHAKKPKQTKRTKVKGRKVSRVARTAKPKLGLSSKGGGRHAWRGGAGGG